MSGFPHVGNSLIGVIEVIRLGPGKVLLALEGSLLRIRPLHWVIYFEVSHFDPKNLSIAISEIRMSIYSLKLREKF